MEKLTAAEAPPRPKEEMHSALTWLSLAKLLASRASFRFTKRTEFTRCRRRGSIHLATVEQTLPAEMLFVLLYLKKRTVESHAASADEVDLMRKRWRELTALKKATD